MGRRLPDKAVYRIRIRIKAGKAVPAITEAVKIAKRIIYKMRLNLGIDRSAEPHVTLTAPVRACKVRLLHP